MLEWFSRLFGAPSSSSVAKERLRLVLLSDHIALAPDVVEELRRDLIEVISRYVVVDEPNSDVSFEHKEAGIAMLANIPIVSVNRPNGNGARKRERPTLPAVAIVPTPSSPPKPPVRKRRRRKKAQSAGSAPVPAIAQ